MDDSGGCSGGVVVEGEEEEERTSGFAGRFFDLRSTAKVRTSTLACACARVRGE